MVVGREEEIVPGSRTWKGNGRGRKEGDIERTITSKFLAVQFIRPDHASFLS
jgi:hypothetical protein